MKQMCELTDQLDSTKYLTHCLVLSEPLLESRIGWRNRMREGCRLLTVAVPKKYEVTVVRLARNGKDGCVLKPRRRSRK